MFTELSTTPPKFMKPTVQSTFSNYEATENNTEKEKRKTTVADPAG